MILRVFSVQTGSAGRARSVSLDRAAVDDSGTEHGRAAVHMTPMYSRRCVGRGSSVCGRYRDRYRRGRGVCWLLHGGRLRPKARGVWRCARLTPPVSMVRSPTETGGETRTVDLPKSEPTLRTDATIERSPIGPTGEARCTAFKVRSAPTLPVPPGCGIRFEPIVMRERMPTRAGREQRQIRIAFERLSRVLDLRTRVSNCWSQCDQV
jgi:hypothetical protein